MATTTKTTDAVRQAKVQADLLAQQWVLVATNDGTYGGDEAVRAVGTADPLFATCKIYEQVGTGRRKTEGCDQDRAPGRMRHFNRELTEKQQQLAQLRKAAGIKE